MARIGTVPARRAGIRVQLAYVFTRRFLGQRAGRATERMIEPLAVYAHAPGLMQGYAALEQATAKAKRREARLRHLAELKAATLTQCEYCIDLGAQVARRAGLSDAHLLALPSYRTSPLFKRAREARARRRGRDEPHAGGGVGRAVCRAARARRRGAGGGDHAWDCAGTHARPLQPGARHRAAGFSAGRVCAVPAPVVPVAAESAATSARPSAV